VKLGRAGIEQIVEIELTAQERTAFDHSVQAVQGLVDTMAAQKTAQAG
jgi:malate/lactate dehydrogenase